MERHYNGNWQVVVHLLASIAVVFSLSISFGRLTLSAARSAETPKRGIPRSLAWSKARNAAARFLRALR